MRLEQRAIAPPRRGIVAARHHHQQGRAGAACQDFGPAPHHLAHDLLRFVERAEPNRPARGGRRGSGLRGLGGGPQHRRLIQPFQGLGVFLRALIIRLEMAGGHPVIDAAQPRGEGIADHGGLDRGGLAREDGKRVMGGMSRQIHQDMDAIVADQARRRIGVEGGDGAPRKVIALDTPADVVVARPGRVAEHLEARPVVTLQDRLDPHGGGMIAEIRRDIADAKAGRVRFRRRQGQRRHPFLQLAVAAMLRHHLAAVQGAHMGKKEQQIGMDARILGRHGVGAAEIVQRFGRPRPTRFQIAQVVAGVGEIGPELQRLEKRRLGRLDLLHRQQGAAQGVVSLRPAGRQHHRTGQFRLGFADAPLAQQNQTQIEPQARLLWIGEHGDTQQVQRLGASALGAQQITQIGRCPDHGRIGGKRAPEPKLGLLDPPGPPQRHAQIVQDIRRRTAPRQGGVEGRDGFGGTAQLVGQQIAQIEPARRPVGTTGQRPAQRRLGLGAPPQAAQGPG